MPKYIVELRKNDFNVTEADPVEGYLGLVHRGDRLSPAVGCVKDRSCALVYDTRNLSDEFFDRYFLTVVEVTAAVVEVE